MTNLNRKIVLDALDAAQVGANARSFRLSAQQVELRDELSSLFDDARIIGYGYPGKGGFYATSKGMPKIAIYARSDDDAKALESDFPKEVRIPGTSGRAGIEIVALGDVKPMVNLTGRSRPAQPGMSISHVKMPSGTLGAIARKTGNENDLFILSCNHVLTEYCLPNVGDPIIQPGGSDRGKVTDKIAELYEAAPLKFHDHEYLNTVDAAIAKVDDHSSVNAQIAFLGHFTPASGAIRRGMNVTKCGRTTARSQGKILDTAARIRLPYKRDKSSTSLVGFTDVVLCTSFSQGGDSGALVINDSGAAVGLIMAGSSRASVFCKINSVCAKLDIELLSGIA